MRPASLRAALHGVSALLLLAACGDAAQAPTTAGGDPDAEPGMALFGGSGDAAHRRRACDGRKYHQFDFWLGKWNITTQGTPAGTNILRKELDGCAVMESYAAQGFVGRSLNSYDAATNRWHQHWVDHVGTVLDLFGSFQGGSMVLQGVRPTPAGNNNVDRITWTPLPEGVRQLWETSTDFGATFPGVQFDGLYERAATLVRDPGGAAADLHRRDAPRALPVRLHRGPLGRVGGRAVPSPEAPQPDREGPERLPDRRAAQQR